MFADIANTALALLKLAPRYLFVVVVVTGVLLFAPTPWIEKISLQEFANDYRQWIGFAFLISATLCGVALALGIWKAILDCYFYCTIRLKVLRRLRVLTEDEKQILRYYLANNTRANMLKIEDGVVRGLVADQVIYIASPRGNVVEGFAHNISETVWKHLHANPSLLEGTTKLMRTDKRW